MWRDALFYKLLHKGIGGNFIDIIQAMYRNVYYCVKLPHGITPSFESTVGVKQGCVLSPILFNLFLSDLPDIFTHECDPVSLGNRFVSCLMFADDLVILSETPAGLQSALSKLQKYTEDWNLTINTNKTKVIIFNKGGHKISKFKFLVNSEELEMVQNYCYLGLIFSSCGSFTEACKNRVSKASKAFFKLTQLNVKEKVPVALKLFDSLVTLILSYASEVWGPTYLKKLDKADFRVLCDTHVVEKLHVKLCKYLLGVKEKSVNSAVLGELGRLLVLIKILSQSFKFWIRTANFPKEHLVSLSLCNVHESQPLAQINSWESGIHQLKRKFDPHLIYNCSDIMYQLMVEEYVNLWHAHIGRIVDTVDGTGNKLSNYSTFKHSFDLEKYVLQMSLDDRRNFTKLRISCHDLAIETGRYSNNRKPLSERICNLCNLNQIEDEFHFFMTCPFYNDEREIYKACLQSLSSMSLSPTRETYTTLMQCANGDLEFSRATCQFVNACFAKRKSSL